MGGRPSGESAVLHGAQICCATSLVADCRNGEGARSQPDAMHAEDRKRNFPAHAVRERRGVAEFSGGFNLPGGVVKDKTGARVAGRGREERLRLTRP
jgi:hypothetical protein